ncbi:helix-turn-helix domain-containing protein [Kocuria sp. HSID16901]|uniref:helix-turn-helix domain-containing protein n=2 Tax=Kocuria TaxID=57493 RepID=UPI00406C7C6B
MDFHGFSRRKTATLAGVSAASVGNLAGGYRTQCSADTARKIAKALGVPTASLFLLKPVTVNHTDIHAKRAA